MPESSEPLPSSAPVRVDEVIITPEGIAITGRLPAGFRIPDAYGPFSVVEPRIVPEPSRAGVEWADVTRWEHQRDTDMLVETLVDLGGMDPADARALAAALRPLDEAGREPAELVSRAGLRRLVERAQHAGPEMTYAWGSYRDAGAERLTTWQAFVAGIRAAAEWARRG